MIAKILKPTLKFSGIIYSQRKISDGKASFSGAFNFPFSQDKASPETYIAYLEALAACADKQIKNRQFHATISTKGKEHDETFLLDISQKWMDKMGYGSQPYLIYFHGDTANNHVHIVSCRVTEDGKIINPYMEGRRAGLAIRELMNENLKEKAAFDIKDAIQNYSFSTIAQFKLILEQRGWTVREKDDKINLIKFVNQGSIDNIQITDKASKYEQNQKRVRQLRSIFMKYGGLPTSQFQNFMRENFGVEIIFHKAKNHSKPYGYTVLDHAHKCVMKGGEIMPIEALLSPKGRDEQLVIANEIVKNNLLNNPSYRELKKTLSKNGFYLKKNNISIKGDDEVLLKIPKEQYRHLHYNDRLMEANKFVVQTPEEAKIVSHIYNVRVHYILLREEKNRDDSASRDMIRSFAANKESLKNYLNDNQMKIVGDSQTMLLIDTKNHTLANISGLGLNVDDLDVNLERSYENMYSNIEDIAEGVAAVSLLSAFLGIFDNIEQPQEHDARARKRKKKRQISI